MNDKVHSLPANRQPSDIARIVADGDRLHAEQRRIVRDMETRHALARADLIDGYRRRLDDLQYDANEALRMMDARHEREITEARKVLQAIERMRGGDEN